MALAKLSPGHISKAMKHAAGLKSRVDRMKEKSEEKMGVAVHTLLASGTSFGLGVLHGHQGKPTTIAGLPVELIGGVAGHALGLLGFGGKFQSVMHGVADGALGVYAYNMGSGVGRNLAAKSGSGVRGELPSDRLNLDETRRMQQPVEAQR